MSHYCAAAIEQGLTVLGIPDHTALPDNRWSHVRIDIGKAQGVSLKTVYKWRNRFEARE